VFDAFTKSMITKGESLTPFQRLGALVIGLMTFGLGIFWEYDAFDTFRNGGGGSLLAACMAVVPLLLGALVLRNACRFKMRRRS
jgi:hypothetical protein